MAAARENEIGRCTCPVCASDKARLRVSAKQLPYVVCDACHVQVFARSDVSDRLLRDRLIAEPVAKPEPVPEPVKAGEQEPAQQPIAVPQIKPQAPAKSLGWGIMR